MNIKIIIQTFTLFFVITVSAQESLPVSKAVSLALENNYGIKIANKSVEVAENNTSILNSGYLPTLTGNAGANYNLDNNESEFSSGDVTTLNGAESSNYNASLNLNYTLFDGQGRRYDYKQLKEEYQLSELEARETIESTMIELLSVYYTVAKLTENANALQETLEISKNRLTRADYQFEYGQSSKLEVLNAEVDINNDSINIINERQELKNSKRDLNFVLGNVLQSNFKVDTLVTFAFGLDKADMLEKMKRNNVSLLQLDKNILIGEYDIKSNKSSYLPTLDLIGSYGWNKNNNNGASFVSVSTNTGLTGGLSLSWDIFDGGSTITNVKNAKINLESQQLQKEQILIDVERNFNNAWDDYQNKLIIYQVQERNIVTAKNNFERTNENFKLGQVTSIEFRQAQLNLLNTEVSRNQAKYDAKLSELEVLQLSGELLNVNF
ncbi:TolC family protein [Lacinutrix undariae]